MVSYDFRGSFGNLTAGLAAAGKSIQDLGVKLTALDKNGAQMRAGLTTIGDSAGKMGLAAAGGLGLMAKAAMDWESAWAGVSKTVDGSAAEMAKLESELRGLAKVLPASHDEIAAVAEAAGQLGVQRDSIASFTKTMIDLGETTNLSADEASTAIAQMANVMGTAPKDIERVGSALVALGNDGASTERQIILMAQRIAGAGAQIGLVESDLLAIANASASMGVEVEAGGTAISRVFTDMAKATAQGSDKLEVFAEVAGMSAAEFTTAFENDPARAFASFTEGLNGINKAGGDVFGTLDQLKLSDVRVSQSLLGMAASGDMLRKSLDLGAQAWDENSALSVEAAKRYETSAAQTQVAWNNIKDAGIEFGATALPMLAQGADLAADMASAFGQLPGPVKSATTGLLGVTAVLGGGLWFTSKVVNGIVGAKTALGQLGITAGTTTTSLQRMTRTTGGILAMGAAVTILGNELAKATGSKLNTADLQRNLEALADGRGAELLETFAGDLYTVGQTAGKVVEPLKEAVTAFGLFGNTPMDNSRENIEAIDQALAGMVESGDADAAAAMFAKFESGAVAAGRSTEEVRAALDAYFLALENAEAAADGAATATEGAAAATSSYEGAARSAADAAKEEAAALRDSIEAMEAKRDASRAAFDAETAWRQSLKDATAQANKNSAGIRGNSDAALENRGALSNLAGAWNNLSNQTQNMPGRFAAAKKSFIDTAVAMGVPREQARALARELLEIPNKVVTKTSVDPGNSHSVIQGVFDHLMRVNGTVATTRIHTVRTSSDGVNFVSGGRGSADGGTVPKTGRHYADRHHYLLADGEEVISNRHGQADRWRPFLKAINAGRLADGGTAGVHVKMSDIRGDYGLSRVARAAERAAGELDRGAHASRNEQRERMKELRQRERLFTKELSHADKKMQAELDALKELKAARRDLMDAVSSNFRSSLFGGMDLGQAYESGALGSGFGQAMLAWVQSDKGPGLSGGSMSQYVDDYLATLTPAQLQALQGQATSGTLANDAQNAQQFQAALQQLTALGLDGGLFQELAASGNIGAAEYYATLTKAEIRKLERQYDIRNQAASSVGAYVGNAEFKADIREQTKVFREARDDFRESKQELRQLNRRIDHLEKLAERNPTDTGKATADALNNTASRAARSA